MAFQIKEDKPARTVRVICTDEVSVEDFMDYLRDYWIGPHNLGYHHLVDFRQAIITLEFGEILKLVSHAAPTMDSNYSNARTALIVADEDQFELCEFFKHARHQICNPFIREVGVFYDIGAAERWVSAVMPAIAS
ncbi:MAG TPA: hypothetical protein VJ998_03755 [Pseudomonadales bacterium]|nr:hypothetical protein [Pseudomonadales bacterium]